MRGRGRGVPGWCARWRCYWGWRHLSGSLSLGAGSALLPFLPLIGCGCFLLEIPELRKRCKETEKGHLAADSEVLALKTAQARGIYRWNTARLLMVRWRGIVAFAKGAIFLTVTHRLAQIEGVAGGEGPPAPLGLYESWDE